MTAPVALFSSELRRRAQEHPHQPALWFEDETFDYGTLLANAEAIASVLVQRQVKPGSRLIILARPSLDYCRVIVGTLLARSGVVPLSTSLPGDALAALIADAGPSLIFADRGGWAALDSIGYGGDRIGIGDLFGEPGGLKGWLNLPLPANGLPDQAPDDLFSIIYSSGTTGIPKGIAHDTLTRSRFFALGASGGGSRVLLSTALYTNASFCTLVGTLFLGGTCFIQERFDPESFMDLVQHAGIERCFLVPVQIRRILGAPGFDPARLASLRATVMSGSHCAVNLKHELAARWPGDLIENYGLSEGGILTTLNVSRTPDRLDSVGLPLPDYEMHVIGEDGRVLPQGDEGEIVGRSPYMMQGYFNRADLTRDIAWHDEAGNLFQRTGDIGWVDADGYVHISDRKKDVIISGGMNLHAAEIDHLFETHPDIAEAAVVAAPSERWGETPHAFVVLRPGARADAEGLLDWINQRLAREMRVSALRFVETLPRNAMGKVMKRELRQQLWQGG